MTTVMAAVILVTAIGALLSLALGWAVRRYPEDRDPVVQAIDAALPQTQCAQCGYPGCRPYAEAVAAGEALNLCPPGGRELVTRLEQLLGREEAGAVPAPVHQVAVIREAECIGCTLCIKACPVDAIIGAPQAMHTIIESECTGCELCLPPCPVDCIDLVATDAPPAPPPLPGTSSLDDCIRCGLCVPECPRSLLPHELYWYADDERKMAELDLAACILCRKCDRACPSQLPLTQVFRHHKVRLAEAARQHAEADHVRNRVARHTARAQRSGTKVRARPSREERSRLLELARQGDGDQ